MYSLEYWDLPWKTAKAYSSTPDNYGYRPLTANLSQISCAIGGCSSVPFQVIKKILVVVLALCAFLLWNEWMRRFPGAGLPSGWWGQGVLLFGFFLLHPINTQIANYVAANSTLLATIFYALSLFGYLKFRRLARWRYLILSSCAYFLAIMSKEEGITLIAIVLLLEMFFLRGKSWIPEKKAWIGLGALGVVAALGAGLIISHFEPSSNLARGNLARELYFATQLRAYFHYMSTMVWPFQFNFDNLSFRFATELWTAENVVFFLLNLLVVFTGLVLCFKRQIWGLAILGFYITILPASSIIPLSEPVNDHRHIIPFLFFGFGLVYSINQGLKAIKESWVQKILVAGLFVFLAGATVYRNLDFVSNKALWLDTALKNPTSPRAQNNLALEYMGERDYKTAIAILNTCLRNGPYYYNCYLNLAVSYVAIGEPNLAEVYFKKALEYDYGRISSRSFYANFLIARGRESEALVYLEQANQFANGMHRPIREQLNALKKRMRK